MNSPDYKKIDELLQYIILEASHQDEFTDIELGPIHLLKYVYLADLEYAKGNNGKTYTGLTWKFHHYGPWSLDLYNRLEIALKKINAEKKNIVSKKYDNDLVRWKVGYDESLYKKLSDGINNLLIKGCIQSNVRKHGASTESLLHHVYMTLPMLSAAPEEELRFDFVVKTPKEQKCEESAETNLTERQKKKKKQAVEELRNKFKERLEANKKRKKKRMPPSELPLYDDIYFEGVEYLDSLAGPPIETMEGVLSFSDDIWHSRARFDPDLA